LYLKDESIAENDFNSNGFQWINADDGLNSVFTFLRYGADGKTTYAIASNFTPIKRENYPIGLPFKGKWTEVLNTDAQCYGGSGAGNTGYVVASKDEINGFPFGAFITLPPMSTIVFKHSKQKKSLAKK
jgi:1,4-alpha-glucan branching enzyme